MTGQLRLLSGRKLKSPHGIGTRPTVARVREAVMNLLRERLANSKWLDLCSGSGVIGCEALERGAKEVIAIESDYKSAQICKENLAKTRSGLSHQNYIKVIRSDVLKWLKSNSGENIKQFPTNRVNIEFDVVYFDPPYESNLYLPVLKALHSCNFLSEDTLVICEHAANQAFNPPKQWKTKFRRVYGQTALTALTPHRE
ncbi:16S rRNA (guanine(966)-N(2))-methyltransferase RsmD [Prochlorococcus sp. MIT 1300]|uniref:16S rRNA (guanine(966)-N(2))-methyltransferase RsmD n=1 Tax=Prochlorococcus sp. MIT 1300 TaxID=3096218 RepID=UPI002A74D326|nr:16S rRNA (guanine(966)-N(2))-methyltransferase RsmD [Prochlorococcus sp. MIT 1300]